MEETRYAMICHPHGDLSDDQHERAMKALEKRKLAVAKVPAYLIETIRNTLPGSDKISLVQFTLGLDLLLASGCTAIYFPKGWEDDIILKDLYVLAFKYGKEILTEEET